MITLLIGLLLIGLLAVLLIGGAVMLLPIVDIAVAVLLVWLIVRLFKKK